MKGSSIALVPNVLPASNSYSYEWSPPEGLMGDVTNKDVTAAPEESAIYSINVRSTIGCSTTATVRVDVIDLLHIPSAFSPNHDGINDTFTIFNGDNQIENVRVYNRWGEVIFNSTNGYDRPWDGTYKNTELPAGVYPYIITTAAAGEYKGEVMLLK